ncbi:hypothetical protein ELQ87_13580 [Streptomyces griseoviridis]|uniref:DUF5709 domain-containing protein n=1 Tax=Streptomyces griseoviridis TaxID=45398 RepID=A0A3S9ZBN0_STRGD|nr:hypothetical protein [Streptomyces griseoviridis]AZS85212.1 hypothetical protein ELQ87_13580 [Streptomyces griseoviridis]QCN87938.1 hypothetical protein DDJ31_25720 [Streptomyces griseoviridis]
MAVDPSDPTTFEDTDTPDPSERDVEVPEDDAAEQRTAVAPEHDAAEGAEGPEGADRDRADEGDLAEQARVVSLDEDDYR